MTAAVWPKLHDAGSVVCLAPGRLDGLKVGESGVAARVRTGRSAREVRARLLVAADGARSRVREALGIGVRKDDYGQKAVIVHCRTGSPHRGRAFERFTPTGPIAALPLRDDRVSVVWTLGSRQAERMIELDDDGFRRALQTAFGYRLGRIDRVGARSAYPLYRVRSAALTADRTVLVGNAALSLHPVAGQGFNLALRDIAALAEMLGDAAPPTAKPTRGPPRGSTATARSGRGTSGRSPGSPTDSCACSPAKPRRWPFAEVWG